MTRPWLLVGSSAVLAGGLFGWVGAILVGLGAGVVTASAGQRWPLVVVVSLVAALAGLARVATHDSPAVSPEVIASARAEVVVVGPPQNGPSGPRARVRVERIRGDEEQWLAAGGDVLVFFGDSVPGGVTRGDRLRLTWSVTAINAYDPDFRRFVRASEAGAGAFVFHAMVLARGDAPANLLVRLRDTVTTGVRETIDGDAGALIAGFVTGDDSGMSPEAREAFERTNTSHITAVSGSNVAVLVTLWFWMVPGKRLQRSLPAMLGLVLVIWLYVVLVGMGPGAVRAGLFAAVMLPAARVGRRADPLTALLFVSAAMVLARPGYAENVGYWLSLAASAAMVTILASGPRRAMPPWRQGLIALVAAQLATLPITFAVFDAWSPASLIANLAIGPLVATIFPFAFIVAIVVTAAPWVGGVAGWLPALGADLIITIVERMASSFPLIRAGALPETGVWLIAMLTVLAIAGMSADARRLVRRVEWHRPVAKNLAPIALGAGAGIWIATVVIRALS